VANGCIGGVMAPEHRIAKLLARAGVASRREIERMIAEGRVALDGRVLDTPATLLPSLRGVTVDGNPVEAPAPARLFLYHKPPGLLVTERDPAGRPTIYDRLPKDLPRLVPVGRLDLATEGLLLLTTDGGLKRTLELPATGVERAYRARAYGEISQARLEELIEGIEIDGIRYGPIDANLERRTGANVWIELVLTEGKNREVRNVLDHLGLQVSRLIRTRYGPFVLGDLPAGGVGEVRQHDLVAFTRSLKDGRPSDTRVAAAMPRTATPRVPRSGGEPDAPRRALTRAPQAPRPVTTPPRPDNAAETPRPGFRTPRTTGGNQARSARFAASSDRTDRPPQAKEPGARTARPSRERTDAGESRSGSRDAERARATGRKQAPAATSPKRRPDERRGPQPARTDRSRSERPAADKPRSARPRTGPGTPRPPVGKGPKRPGGKR
jgi:23S rRNA pseudouridine2605 synthase